MRGARWKLRQWPFRRDSTVRIKSQTSLVDALLLVTGVLMIVTAYGLIYGFGKDGSVPPGVWIVAALFSPPGFLLAVFGARQLLQRARFGGWTLECPEGGGRLGQPLVVTLLPPKVVTPSTDVECRLVCFQSSGVPSSTQPGAGRASGRMFDHGWALRAGTMHPGIGLPITLDLPTLGFPSKRGRRGTVEWKLSVTTSADGRTHRMEFELPVQAGASLRDDAAESIEERAERLERAREYRRTLDAGRPQRPSP
jgi:hypothetical protein